MKCLLSRIEIDKGPMTKISTVVRATELPLLQAKHGQEAITVVEPVGEDEVDPQEEYNRLMKVYGRFSDEETWAEHILGRGVVGMRAIMEHGTPERRKAREASG